MQPLPVGKLLAASYEESCEDYTAVSLAMSVHCPALNSFCKLNHFPYIGLCDKEFVSIFLYEYHHRSLVLDKNLRKLYTTIVERRLKIKNSAKLSVYNRFSGCGLNVVLHGSPNGCSSRGEVPNKGLAMSAVKE